MEVLINQLDEVQKTHGWLPEEEIVRIAREQNMPKSHLYGVISFYSRFYTAPVGRYVVRVCKSVSCGMNSSRIIRNDILAYLGLHERGTTADGLFTLELVECLGHCSQSPVMMINDTVHGNLTSEKALAILSALREQEGNAAETAPGRRP